MTIDGLMTFDGMAVDGLMHFNGMDVDGLIHFDGKADFHINTTNRCNIQTHS